MAEPFEVGATSELIVTFDVATVARFAEATGDANPIHLDAAFAATTRFGRPIVHGALIASQFSRVLAESLPGPGTIYLEQCSRFVRPVFVGDTVRIALLVESFDAVSRRATLSTVCYNPAGKPAVEGTASVIVPE